MRMNKKQFEALLQLIDTIASHKADLAVSGYEGGYAKDVREAEKRAADLLVEQHDGPPGTA